MNLRLYDSRSRSLRDFQPLRPGKASMYVCGITVQGKPHIGHMRFAVAFDILRRWLTRTGHDVTMVRNVTDIDDKILIKSEDLDVDWWKFAYLNELACTRAYDVLGNLPPTYEPRATGHMTDMVELMQILIERGHAYAVDGDVYFDVRSWPAYGELSGARIDELRAADDTQTADRKRDVRDFALWKGRKDTEPATASWPTPWGAGRPGWHLECSAMARRYLGTAFDIHGGGIDLRFPHHENELAQSTAAGDSFASNWLHNGLVTVGGEKMSKSLGNTLLVDDIIKTVRPVDIRFYLGTAHYRSTIDYSANSLVEANAAYSRLENFIELASAKATAPDDLCTVELPAAFVTAMNDDLGVSGALAVVYEQVRAGNIALQSGDSAVISASLAQVRAMLDVLGLDPLSPQWATSGRGTDSEAALDAVVGLLLTQRAKARADRDFSTSDRIRDELRAAGVAIEDKADGPRWTLQGQGGVDAR